MLVINKIPTLEEFIIEINEDIVIPAQLSTRYLAVKKQLEDKQIQKNALVKQINQKDTEIGILNKNLIAIEAQAAQLQGKEAQDAQQQEAKKAQGATPASGQATPAATPTTESKIEMEWKELDEKLFGKRIDPLQVFDDVIKDLNPDEEYPEDSENFGFGDPRFSTGEIETDNDYDLDQNLDLGEHPHPVEESVDSDEIDILEPIEVEGQDPKNGGEVEEVSPDYLFAVRVHDLELDEDIIAKIYRNEDDEFWKIRVVQGSEQPLEAMQLDPDMTMVDIIEKIAEIPGYEEVEEVDVEDYEDLIDDKAESDEKFYGHEKAEKVREQL